MEIRIREASKKDIRTLTQLVFEFRNEHSRMLGGGSNFTINDAKEEVERYMKMRDTGYFVAADSENRLLGFRRWELHDGFYFTRELYIIPNGRGQGIARELIRHFEKWVLKKGQDIACISCIPHNAAMISLARSEGYEILNMIEMRKDLIEQNKKPWGEAEALGLKWKTL